MCKDRDLFTEVKCIQTNKVLVILFIFIQYKIFIYRKSINTRKIILFLNYFHVPSIIIDILLVDPFTVILSNISLLCHVKSTFVVTSEYAIGKSLFQEIVHKYDKTSKPSSLWCNKCIPLPEHWHPRALNRHK